MRCIEGAYSSVARRSVNQSGEETFELEFDAQLFPPVGRSFAFGFHLERRLGGSIINGI